MKIVLESCVRDYMDEISSAVEQVQLDRYLERQSGLGYRVEMPVSAFLRNGIYEIRPGPHRLLYFYYEGEIVVIHAFRKKTNRTPDNEIDRALRKAARYLEGI